MSAITAALRDRRLAAFSQARQLADTAAQEGRRFTAEEQQTWDRLNAEIDSIDTRARDMLAAEERARGTEEAFARLEGRPQTLARAGDGVSDELRAMLRGEPGARRHYDLMPTDQDRRWLEQRSILKTGAGQGTLVPETMYGQLVSHMIEVSGILQAGPTVLNTSGGGDVPVPKTTAHGTATPTAEGGTIASDDPTFGVITLGAYKYADLIQVSSEMLQDDAVGLEGYLATMAGRALGNAIGGFLVTGTGSDQPGGAATFAGTAKTGPNGVQGGFGTQSAVGQGLDLLIDVYHSVISPYRQSPSCAWLMADLTAAEVRKIKDSNGDYVWQPSPIVGQPDSLLGKPVYIDPFVPAKGTASMSVLFGDWRAYFVRYAGGIRFERSDDFAFDQDLVTFRAVLRGDGNLVDRTGAIKGYRGGTA